MSLESVAERREKGLDARRATPWASQAEWAPASDRPDPIGILQAQNAQRIPWLVPVRHARMRASPFAFYRGTASIMATDLATTAVSGFDVQLGGDAHLLNFGAYASPERHLVFDASDFDETLTGPWEWDLKRLAVSFLVACRHLQFGSSTARRITARVVEGYRDAMRGFGQMRFLELWYERTHVEDLRRFGSGDRGDLAKRIEKFEMKARSKNSLHALRKLAVEDGGRFRIRSDRPVLVPIREVLPEFGPEEIELAVQETFADYLTSLRDDRRRLLERYELVDIALKVVGVGSVGTACYILLLEGRDRDDPLFLQAKEANTSVLEPHLHPSHYAHHGERVVQGQRQIQAQSDICLGWATGSQGRPFYFRQLRDWKRSFDVDSASPDDLEFYAELCGHVLARGHARSGDPVAISCYMGESTEFDDVIVVFCERYADGMLADFETFQAAIADGSMSVASDGD